MRIRWSAVAAYVVLGSTVVASHAKGTTIGTVAEGLALALAPFVPAAVTNKPKGDSQQ